MISNTMRIPNTSLFQYAGNGNGAIKENVNLFRGAVSFQYPLVHLPERNGIGINLMAMYQSDIDRIVNRSNLSAPTSIIGLGWHFGFERIEMISDSSTIASERKYCLCDGINRMELKKTSRLWKRGTLTGLLEDDKSSLLGLFNRQDTIKRIKDSFHKQQILLSDTINYIEKDQDEGIIEDKEFKNIFLVRRKGKELSIYDGGIQYENSCFDFSRITFYQQYDKWVITDKHGNSKIYGDKQLQYGVCYQGWNGSSNLKSQSQRNYVKAYNLMCECSIWNDRINYEYENCMQAVGEQGLTYTKACYLSKITDMFGYQVVFNYNDKEYDKDNIHNPREYIDPHKEVPSDAPDAYQSCYETKYLKSIQCYSVDNECIQNIQFVYKLCSFHNTQYLDQTYISEGDYSKRLLTDIQVSSKEDSESFGNTKEETLTTTFIYNEIDEVNKGALKQIKYPEGATVSYQYTVKELPNCSKRALEIPCPIKSSTPSVWFGDDYVVCGWKTDTHMQLSIYTWVGRWQIWTIENKLEDFDIDSMEVITESMYVLLKGFSRNKNKSIYMVIHKNPHARGGFLETEPVIVDSTNLEITTGETIFIIDDLYKYSYKMIRWNELEETWKEELTCCYASDRRNYFAINQNKVIRFDYDQESMPEYKKSQMYLYTIDDLYGVRQQVMIDASQIVMLNDNKAMYHSLIVSGPIVAFVAVEEQFTQSFTYTVNLFTITNNEVAYSIENTFSSRYTCYKGNIRSIDANIWTPKILGNTFVTVDGYLYRYNGVKWLVNDTFREQLGMEQVSRSFYAYGDDLVVKTECVDRELLGQAIKFDPNKDSLEWNTKEVTIAHKVGEIKEGSCQPTASGNIITWDLKMYRIEPKDNYKVCFDEPIYNFPNNIVSTSLLNAAPYYIAGMLKSSENSDYTLTYVLEDDHLKLCEQLNESFNDYENKDMFDSIQKMGPASASSFYTYVLDRDKKVQSIKLYELSGDSLQRPIESYQVSCSKIYDGLQTVEYEYSYDEECAVCDPSSQFIQYYVISAYPIYDGKRDLGYIKYLYKNSLANIRQNENSIESADLDGQLFCTETYDNNNKLMNRVHTEYELMNEVYDANTDSMVPIYGGYLYHTIVYNKKDGVLAKSQIYVSKYTGEQHELFTDNYDGAGQLMVHKQKIIYACEQDRTFYYTNQLSCIVADEKYVISDEQTSMIDRKIYEYDNNKVNFYGANGDEESYYVKAVKTCKRYNGEQLETNELGYRTISTVISRNNHGQETERETPIGMTSTLIYDKYDQNIVAEFSMVKASAHEAFYYGFEERERLSLPWGEDNSLTIVEDISHTGYRSLQWSKDNLVPKLTFTIEPSLSTYLVGFWCLCDGADEGLPTINISVDQINNINSSPDDKIEYSITIEHSKNWRYYSQEITVNGPSKITFEFINDNEHIVYLDNIYFCAKDAAPKLYTYNKSGSLLTQVISAYDQCRDYVYDRFNREVAQIDHERTQIQLQLLNQVNTARDKMNSVLYLKNMKDAYYDRNTSTELTRFFVYERESSWSYDNGIIHTKSDSVEKLTLSKPSDMDRYAVYMQVTVDENDKDRIVGLQINNNHRIYYDWKSHQYVLQASNKVIETNNDVVFSNNWLLIYDTISQLLIDGKVVFSFQLLQDQKGELSMISDGTVRVDNLMVLNSPQIGIQYYDLCGKLRQGISLETDKHTITELLYDSAGRVMLHTKPACIKPKESKELLAYKEDFITKFDPISGIMKGVIADEYIEDDGYPYMSQRYEAKPNGRVIEKGAAGKTFAIGNIEAMNESQRHTEKKQYGTNDEEQVYYSLDLPKDQYYTTITTDQDGKMKIEVNDQLGHNVASYIVSPTQVDNKASNNNEMEMISINRNLINYQHGRIEYKRILPNGTIRKQIYNPLGELLESEEPNSGSCHYIYNEQGKLRFMQDAVLKKEDKWLYYRYDVFGRSLDSGTIVCTDTKKLKQLAMCALWPEKKDGAVILRKQDYDNTDMADPNSDDKNTCCNDQKVLYGNQHGMLTHAVRFDDYGKQPISNYNMYYDSRKRIVSYKTSINKLDNEIKEDPYETETYEQRYQYDTLNNLIQMTYASGYQVNYEYDEIGRLTRIYDELNQSICQYSYYPNDMIKESIYGDDNVLSTTYQYNSLGWITSISNSYFNEEIVYNKDNDNGPFDGKISYVRYQLKGDMLDNEHTEVTYELTYDDNNRIVSAICKNSKTGQIIEPWTIRSIKYDKNSNIVSVNVDDEVLQYEYQDKTDKVTKIDGFEQFTYDENGSVKSSKFHEINDISYDPTKLAKQIKTKDTKVIFEYNNDDKRLVKQTDSQRRVYLTNGQGKATEEIQYNNGVIDPIHTEYIYGPYGMTAMRRNGAVSYLCLDHLGSVRVRVDKDKKILNAVQYSPYGDKFDVLNTANEASKDLRYYYTGHEWDEETSLYNAKARFYDPVLKRFYSIDPKLENDSPYIFCNNDPLLFTDPDGESSWWAILVGGIVSLALTVVTLGTAAVASAAIAASTTVVGTAATVATIAANAAIGAVGCAASSVIGSTITSAIDSEPITAQMLLSSFASGFVGGGVSSGIGVVASGIDFAGSALKAFGRASVNGIAYATGSIAGGISSGAINGKLGNGSTWLELGLSSLIEFGAGMLASKIDMNYTNKYNAPASSYKHSFFNSMEQSTVSGGLQARYSTQSIIESSLEGKNDTPIDIKQEMIAVHNIGADVVTYKANGSCTIKDQQGLASVLPDNTMKLDIPVKLQTCYQAAYSKETLTGETFRNIVKDRNFGFQTVCGYSLVR